MSIHDAKNDPKPGQFTNIGQNSYANGLLSRLQWVMFFTQERPLISWTTGETPHDAKVLPPFIKQSRRTFIASTLVVLVPALLVTMPIALQLKPMIPFARPLGRPPRCQSTTMPVHHDASPCLAEICHDMLQCLLAQWAYACRPCPC